MESLTNLGWEIWLALGIALLAAEALGASGFLIGAAVAALALSLIAAIFDLSWVSQIVIYAVTAVIATIVYFQMFRDAQRSDGAPPINQRAASMIGTIFTLEESIDEQGRVQIGDTFWKVETSGKLAAGTEVEVTASEGMALILEPRSP